MAYSESHIAEVLAALEANEGNIKLTAKQFGHSWQTVKRWHCADVPGGDTDSINEKSSHKKRELADKLENIAHGVLDSILDREYESIGFKEGMTGIGIAIDKMRLLRGVGDGSTAGMDDFINAMRS